MVNIKIPSKHEGHETFQDLTVEEAKKLIHEVEETGGGRYFIKDLKTGEILKELKLQEDQDLVMLPMVGGG